MPPSLTFVTRTIAFVVLAVAIAVVSAADCITIPLKKSERFKGPVARPTLIFGGTVTAINAARIWLAGF